MVWRVESFVNLSQDPISWRNSGDGPQAATMTVQPQRSWSDPFDEWRSSCTLTIMRHLACGEVHIQEQGHRLEVTSVDATGAEIDSAQLIGATPPSAASGPSLRIVFTLQCTLCVTPMSSPHENVIQRPIVVHTAASDMSIGSQPGQMFRLRQAGTGIGMGDFRYATFGAANGAASAVARVNVLAMDEYSDDDEYDEEGSSEDEEGEPTEEEALHAAAALTAATTATLELEVVLNAILADALVQAAGSAHAPVRSQPTLNTLAASRALARFLHPPAAPSVPERLDLSGPKCVQCQERTLGPSVPLKTDVALRALLTAFQGVQEKEIQSLPNALESSEDAMESALSQQVCVLCLCSYQEPTTLVCGHSFCRGCIHAALLHRAACPVCRAKCRPTKKLRPVNKALVAMVKACSLPQGAPGERSARHQAILQAAQCPMCNAALMNDPVTSPCGHSACRSCMRDEEAMPPAPASVAAEQQQEDSSPPVSPASSRYLRDSLLQAEIRMQNAQQMGAATLRGVTGDDVPVLHIGEEAPREGIVGMQMSPRPTPLSQGWIAEEGDERTSSGGCACRCVLS